MSDIYKVAEIIKYIQMTKATIYQTRVITPSTAQGSDSVVYRHLQLPGPFHLLYWSSALKLIFLTWDELSEAAIFGEFKIKHFSHTGEQYRHKTNYFFLK